MTSTETAMDMKRDAAHGRPAICIRGLEKRYGRFQAVRGIDLVVHTGEIFAFLGPNGAGKTTTVEILEGSGPGRRARSASSASTPQSRRALDRPPPIQPASAE